MATTTFRRHALAEFVGKLSSPSAVLRFGQGADGGDIDIYHLVAETHQHTVGGVVLVLGDNAERFVAVPGVVQEEGSQRLRVLGVAGEGFCPLTLKTAGASLPVCVLAYTMLLPSRSPSFHPLTYLAQMSPSTSTLLSRCGDGAPEGGGM